METDLINKYIEKLNDNVCELTKKVIVLEVQLTMAGERERQREEEFIEKENQLRSDFEGQLNVVKDDYASHLNAANDEYQTELATVIAQRIELQDQCNELRRNLIDANERYENLLSERENNNKAKVANPRRKKKDDFTY
jgi:DNA anti-recombination protein RmuC